MNTPSLFKRVCRSAGIEVKHMTFGLDAFVDLQEILGRFPSPMILDVGANEGQTCLKLSDIAPSAKIWSFEPNRTVFETLVENTRSIPNITPVHTALGSTPGIAKLRITGSSVNTSLLEYNNLYGNDAIIREEEVEVVTLADFCRKEKIGDIALLKVDTQGFDLEVLRGAETLFNGNHVAAVFIEVMFTPTYTGQAWFEDIFQFLNSHSMKFSGFYDIRRERDYFIHWADALFVNPTVLK